MSYLCFYNYLWPVINRLFYPAHPHPIDKG
jgi:hypothetical protein